MKNISKFQYLTQDIADFSHQELAELACKNGIKWVQLRVKNKSFDDYLSIAKEVRKITEKHQVSLIINDNVSIAKQCNAEGVHLGKNDMHITEARKILGNNKIIGATANTFDDILNAFHLGADYIGLGPYKHTNTKENISAILGISGYQTIINKCIENNLNIPIIAIGGIKANDVQELIKTNVHGIAVSSALHHDDNFKKNLNEFTTQGILDI